MGINQAVRAAMSANAAALSVAIRKPGKLKPYLAGCWLAYREAAGLGLEPKYPFETLSQEGYGSTQDRFQMPLKLHDDSGTRWEEQMCLGAVTVWLKPKAVFEFGTYNGRTASIFILNAPAESHVYSLDLPEGAIVDSFVSDKELSQRRRTGYIVSEMGIANRFSQILCNSLEFDPKPYANQIELGFIDGGHSLKHVMNDTMKMAVMAASRGLVLWHDYGGQGDFRDLTRYLEQLARTIPVYRVPGMSLAWARMADLRKLMS